MAEPETLFSQRAGMASITLNRPAVLNALSPTQFAAMAGQLAAWEQDDAIGAIIIEGAGERAFCAGGDIRAVWDARLRGDDAFNRKLFADEYRLDRHIHRYTKPYVALMDGIVMGGGAGVSVNGRYRVATERTLFAMPEAAIGFFPDVGATHFLSRLPGRLGLYLGLTGARLGAADCLWAGLATHFVPAAELERLKDALQLAANSADPHGAIASVLAQAHGDPGPAHLPAIAESVDRCFGGADPTAMVAALRAEDAEWARRALAAMDANAPFSLAVTCRQLIAGKSLDYDDCMRNEYRLACRFLAGHDFYEGIRALVVDKDRRPRWSPASLAEIDEAAVAAMFAPLGQDELEPEPA